MKRAPIFSVLACFLLIANVQADDKDKDSKKVVGTWQLKEAELAVHKLPAEVVKNFQLTLTVDKYTL